MRRALLGLVALSLLGGVALLATNDAEAQKIDPRRPTSLVVGAPRGASPMQRVDARRSGVSKTNLPSGPLAVAWHKTTGLSMDQGALAGADGTLAVISGRGDVTFLDENGDEKGNVRVGASQIGPAAIASDGTVVFVTSSGDVVGVKRGLTSPRFTTRIGGERNIRTAPLSLDDGGMVVATLTDLLALDSDGNVRARVSVPEPPAAPLIAFGDKILVITDKGTVYGWTLGRDPVRVASFGAPIDGGAALTQNGTLVAVIEGNHLAEVDVVHGNRSTWIIAPQGLLLGPPALRDVPGGGSVAMLTALTSTRGYVVAYDNGGQELLRAPVAAFVPSTLADGGPPPLVAPPHVGPIADARGTIAFASTDGRIGLISPDGTLDTLSETFCTKSTVRAGVVGLTPFGNGAFAVTCDGGLVLRVVGAGSPKAAPTPAPSAPSSAAPAPPSSSDKLRRRSPGF